MYSFSRICHTQKQEMLPKEQGIHHTLVETT